MLRNWKFRGDFEEDEELYISAGQYMAGNIIGILLSAVFDLNLNENLRNAKTFPFPVRYKVINSLLTDESSAEAEIKKAVSELEHEGCRAIATSGGKFGLFDSVIKNCTELISVSTPLAALSFVDTSIPDTDKRFAVINDLPVDLNRQILESIGIPDKISERCVFSENINDGFVGLNKEKISTNEINIGAYIWDKTEKCPIETSGVVPIYSMFKMIMFIKEATSKMAFNGFI